jgi:predicted  nucleic acid-binding Zn-ribbon protein
MFENLKKGMASLGLAESVEVAETGAASVPVVTAVAPAPAAAPNDDAERIAKYDESAKAALQEALKVANVQLIPELQSLLSTLEAAIPVEALRFQTALKIFAAKGTPISAVLSEYDVYIGALEEKSRVFSKELQDQFNARVGSKRNAVQDYDTQIAAAKAQIASLEQQVIGLNDKRAGDLSALAEAQHKLDLVQQRFKLQYDAARTHIDQQKAQVAEHGKAL